MALALPLFRGEPLPTKLACEMDRSSSAESRERLRKSDVVWGRCAAAEMRQLARQL